jgi:hypothetical protein
MRNKGDLSQISLSQTEFFYSIRIVNGAVGE